MESGVISDEQITASSYYVGNLNNRAIYARLHFQATQQTAGSWSADTKDVNQWLQVDLSQYTNVARVATQGRDSRYGRWVTEYKLQYSNDGVNFQNYTEQGQNTSKVTYIPTVKSRT